MSFSRKNLNLLYSMFYVSREPMVKNPPGLASKKLNIHLVSPLRYQRYVNSTEDNFKF